MKVSKNCSVHVESDFCVSKQGVAAKWTKSINVQSTTVAEVAAEDNHIGLRCRDGNTLVDGRQWFKLQTPYEEGKPLLYVVKQLNNLSANKASPDVIESWYKTQLKQWSGKGFGTRATVVACFITNRDVDALLLKELFSRCPNLVIICKDTLASHLSTSLAHLPLAIPVNHNNKKTINKQIRLEKKIDRRRTQNKQNPCQRSE